MKAIPRHLLLLVGLWSCLGCEGLARPRWLSPGNLLYQRSRATVHDPYPQPDNAPEMVGVRPREYQRPLPEAVRNQVFSNSRPAY